MITSTDPAGGVWRSAVEVELTRKHRPRVEQILRNVLDRYDDVIYFAAPQAVPVVTAAAEAPVAIFAEVGPPPPHQAVPATAYGL